jgi:aminopeptidase N
MLTTTPQTIRLKDYKAPSHWVETVALDITLDPTATRVAATVVFKANTGGDLWLDGRSLKLLSIAIDGATLPSDRYTVTPDGLTIHGAPDAFTLTTTVEIDPKGNTALEGLYMSGGRFCTQCEAEGFRKITYYPDRPDVLATFTTRITGDAAAYPHLLSNGNRVDGGTLPNGQHFAVWNDPFPKPCYLFALVAGQLDMHADTFVTCTGRTIALEIYVDPGEAHKALYAMDALKRSMKWDEDVFGREYDLDLFMIVAVRDFNFGAMENKGLNIFNSAYLLADPGTATDMDYEAIEGIVAHEYFHNWTGNRITCRDWFQLCLKEGLTVYRDQEFSADQRGHAVTRIKEVKRLRARQFQEDAGPLAHPVRPETYVEINNFYTATVYEKGAEVIRMLRAILGSDGFRKGMDLYFTRHDGDATTIEAFLACFADATGYDLSQFARWYAQAGTPCVTLSATWDAGTLTLTAQQITAPTPGQPDKQPVVIPIRIGFVGSTGTLFSQYDGTTADEHLLVLTTAEHSFVFEGLSEKPSISALRGFSAPVVLDFAQDRADIARLMAADTDLFNRWEAMQQVAERVILAKAGAKPDAEAAELQGDLVAAVRATLTAAGVDDAFKALALALPTTSDLAQKYTPVDPVALHAARDGVKAAMAAALAETLWAAYRAIQPPSVFDPNAADAGQRALRNAVLDLLATQKTSDVHTTTADHVLTARDLTSELGGLSALMASGAPGFADALAAFYARWSHEPLVIDKWFALQARDDTPGAFDRIVALTNHPAFDATTPNRLRAVVMTLSTANLAVFHAIDGSGYRFLTDWVLKTDPKNPALAARLVGGFETWRRLDSARQALIQGELKRVLAAPGLSKNVFEIASKTLGSSKS